MSHDPHRVWWKEPMVWLIAGLPATVVVASFATYFIAAHKPDSLVNEEYVKQGMAVVSPSSGLEENAARRMIAAEIASQDGKVTLLLTGKLEAHPVALLMTVIHPTHSDQDIALRLDGAGDGTYFGALPAGVTGKRRILIEPVDRAWRLSGDAQLSATGSWKIVANSPLSTTRP